MLHPLLFGSDSNNSRVCVVVHGQGFDLNYSFLLEFV